ncbi:response regulator transcription factor [Paenibacillus doosanensis]|uniref:response regulator transcription factor n=1 Tax=Paenibacillus doosanensis TaxID=1229154 RepID=UPI00217FF487|nr:response regulator transcription factor [Paenibacillus doosanensis]MCS7464109.1 response regulator transcription factor [Paenibacillus doosanensis]
MEKETILVADDEKEIRELIAIYLNNEGYRAILATNGMEALELLQRESIDLIILDIMMPKLDGIQACLKIREDRNVPIIMLSAKSQDFDKILGLDTGADDYMTKPFNPLELVARVRSLLRRHHRLRHGDPSRAGVIEIDDLSINTATHEVFASGKEVKLTPKEFAILELFMSNRGMIFSVERIYEKVWNDSFYNAENTVMVHIRKIREKIEVNPRKPQYIKTVWGVGYKIENEKKNG